MKHEEAIKLKPGTPILIKSKIVSVDVTGDIVYETRAHDQEYEVMHARTDCRYVDIQTPEQKLDTCRLFKRGDIVRYVERDGRSYVDAPPVGMTCRVIVGEDSAGIVTVEFKFSENEEPAVHDVPFYHLELITPAGEMGPYKVWDTTFSFNVGVKDTKAVFYYGADMSTCPYNKEQAKAAAEAECKRLNEEYRKDQNND